MLVVVRQLTCSVREPRTTLPPESKLTDINCRVATRPRGHLALLVVIASEDSGGPRIVIVGNGEAGTVMYI